MLTTITLGGHLGRQFGRIWRLDLETPSPAEAVRALSAVCSGFKQYLVENSEPGYHVFVSRQAIGEADLQYPAPDGRLTIMPSLSGAKAGLWQSIAGIVLIAGGAVLTAYGFGAGIPLMTMGASLLIGGVSQMLARHPVPPKPDERKNEASFIFNGPVNTVSQGHCVPICYGEMEVGSQVISAGIVTDAINTSMTGGTGTGGVIRGGGCPAPSTLIRMADGTYLPAGKLEVGMMVDTFHEHTLASGKHKITHVEQLRSERTFIRFTDGRTLVASREHRVSVKGQGWVEVDKLRTGDVVRGRRAAEVAYTTNALPGQVVMITVEEAHTYLTADLLSHNAKRSNPVQES